MLLIFSATADAQICAKEEADGNSSDDEHGIKYKRGSTNANNRKRRAVFDYSDDEEDDNIVSIASPELPKQHTPDPVVGIAEDAEVNQKSLENEHNVPNNGKGSSTVVDSDFTSECKIKTIDPMNDSGITLKEKSSDPPINDKKQDSAAEPASKSPKRRKVLKTRIDERGREGSYTELCKRHCISNLLFLCLMDTENEIPMLYTIILLTCCVKILIWCKIVLTICNEKNNVM
jgi:DNA polymerase delta subunit 3